MFLARDVVT